MQLYTTYRDVGEVPPQRSWSALRALRAKPPGLADRPDRRRVFSSALEQAEQLFTAAAGVGVETKPLLAFYGLSQAGRAIAAARASDSWQLRGHGITLGRASPVPPLPQATNGAGESGDRQAFGLSSLADATVSQNSKAGSFPRMVAVLASSALPADTRVGDLWPLLSELERHPLLGASEDRSLGLHVRLSAATDAGPTIELNGLPGSLAEIGRAPDQTASGGGDDYEAQAEALNRFLDRFPTLRQRQRLTPAGQPIGLQKTGKASASIRFAWPASDTGVAMGLQSLEASLGVRVRGQRRIFPSLDGEARPIHPLIVWWAILYRLSVLARYEPEHWDALTDVNTSAAAVPIEHALDSAMSSLPELIYHALTE